MSSATTSGGRVSKPSVRPQRLQLETRASAPFSSEVKDEEGRPEATMMWLMK